MNASKWSCVLLITCGYLLVNFGSSLPQGYRERRFLEKLFGRGKPGDESPIEEVIDDLTRVLKIPAHKVVQTLEDLGKHVDKWTSKLEDIGEKIVPGLLSKLTPTEYLERFGYLKKTTDGKHSVGALVKALTKFQKMFHKNSSSILDTHTISAMMQSRCGMPDLHAPISEEIGNATAAKFPVTLEKKYNAKGPKWSKLNLTWKLHNYYDSASLPPAVQREAIRAGLQYWQDVSGLTFTETTGTADLNMKFVLSNHGDGTQNAFDGPGGVLAHAFFPESGEAHYDSTEEWTDGVSRGINLKIVTAHEIGHALGLGHSEVEGALMAPYYQGYVANYKLPQDDISGIQVLYGKNTAVSGGTVARPTPAPPAPTLAPTTKTTTVLRPTPSANQPSTCTITFRAVTQIHNYNVYIFFGDWTWKITETGLDSTFPKRISSVYEQAPSNVEAAVFTFKHYFTYLFKGNAVWVYYGFELVGHKTITSYGYPTSLQAAVTGSDERIYIIQGSNVWQFDEETLDITSSTPQKFWTVFPGAPTIFDSILRFHDDTNLFFFRGDYYYKYSETYQTQLSGYPKKKAVPWFGSVCSAYGI